MLSAYSIQFMALFHQTGSGAGFSAGSGLVQHEDHENQLLFHRLRTTSLFHTQLFILSVIAN